MIASGYTKKCLYCGRVNAASALSCAGCGASEFELVPPAYFPPQQPLPAPVPVPFAPVVQLPPVVRFLYFFFVGLLIVFYWLLLATLFLVTVIAQPLAIAMYRTVPTVATLSRTHRPFGVLLGDAWHESVERYRAAPTWGKVLAPLVFVGCLVVLAVLARN